MRAESQGHRTDCDFATGRLRLMLRAMPHKTMATDLFHLADAVHDEETFLAFVEALHADWEDVKEIESRAPSPPFGSGVNGWENGSLGAFLEAAAAWGKASAQGLPSYRRPDNPWRRAAHILHAGKFYE